MHREPLSELIKIRVVDNREPLVDLKKICPGIFIDLEEARLQQEKSLFARRTVAHMLKKAHKLLPADHTFKVRDAWRPQKVQERYYRRALARLRRKQRSWSEARLRRELNKWIFPPDAKTPPWHTTGGAIDLTICNLRGKSLPMKSNRHELPPHIQRNRQLLKEVMEKVGFTNYAQEWWHFSYGDTGWAYRTGRKRALYGLIEKDI